ncbi:MAG: L-threonylcarbamoyladenylate synthase [Vicinamibacterales bacterium]
MSHAGPIVLAAHGVDDDWLIRRVRDVLAAGGIVAYPTETFYGLAVDPRSPAAVERLFRVKGREGTKALPLVAAGVDAAVHATRDWSVEARTLASDHWPGPVTLVVPGATDVRPVHEQTSGTVAIRVPSEPLARLVAHAGGGVVTATSANRAGRPPCATAADVLAALDGDVDLVLDGGPTPGGLPSTIVDTTTTPPSLVRAGAVPWNRVLKSLS